MAKPFNKIKYTGWLGLDDQLTFGSYIGRTILEVLKNRPEYINWLIHNTNIKFYESVYEEIDRWLAKRDTPKPKRTLYSPYGYLLDYDVDQNDWYDDIPF